MSPTSLLPEQEDEKLNPGQRHADELFDDQTRPAGKTSDPRGDVAAGNPSDPRGDLAAREAAADAPAGASAAQQELEPNRFGYNFGQQKSKSAVKIPGLSRKSGIRLILAGSVIGGGGFFLFAATPGIAIVTLKEQMVNKFSRQLQIVTDQRGQLILARKLGGDFVSTGCNPSLLPDRLKRKCRFNGLSGGERKRLQKRAGITVETGKRLPNGKLSITRIKYTDAFGRKISIPASQFYEKLGSDQTLRKGFLQLHKSKVQIFTGNAAKFTYRQFKAFRGKSPPVTTPDEAKDLSEEEKQKARSREQYRKYILGETFDSPNGTRFDVNESGISEEEKKERARKNQILQGVDDSVRADAERIAANSQDPTKRNSRIPLIGSSSLRQRAAGIAGVPFSQAAKRTLKGTLLGPLGVADSLCTAKLLVAGVGYAAKALGKASAIRQTVYVARIADSIKAGEANGAEVAALGAQLVKKDPDTGRSGFESFGASYIRNGSLRGHEEAAQARLGGGLSGSLINNTKGVDKILGVSSCKLVKNPFVVGAAIAVSVVAAIFTFSGSTAASVAINAGAALTLIYAIQVATPILARLIAGGYIDYDDPGPQQVNATVAGFGAMTASVSSAKGLMPQTVPQAVAFDEQTKDASTKLAALDNGNQFDIYNPQTFAGRFVAAALPAVTSSSASNIASSLGKLTFGSFAQLGTKPASAQSAKKESEICQDADYKERNIATDAFCNPIYALPKDVLTNPKYFPEQNDTYLFGDEAGEGVYIDNDGKPKGEFAEFVEKCNLSTEPISEDTDDTCFSTDEKYMHFRTYCVDADIAKTIEERDDDTNGASCVPEPEPPAATPDSGQVATSEELTSFLESLVASKSGNYGVSVREIGGSNRSAAVGGDQAFKTASIYKLFAAYTVYKEIEAGRLSAGDSITVSRQDSDPDDISGKTTVGNCLKLMITNSSDACGIYFLELGGNLRTKINQQMRGLGLTNTNIVAGDNKTSANDVATFLTKLEDGSSGLRENHRSELLKNMRDQRFRNGIPAGTGAPTANKVGWLLQSGDGTKTLNDAGIVDGPNGKYVLSIFSVNATSGNSDLRSAVDKPAVWTNIKEIAKGVHEQLQTAPDSVNVDVGSIGESSVGIPCDPRSKKDHGVRDGYTNGTLVKIRVCELPNLPSSGQESQNQYGFTEASGGALVNSRVSGAFYNLAEAMKKAKLPLVQATSAFRTNEHQIALQGGPNPAAPPGESNHQLGVAIDFQFPSAGNSTGNCRTGNGICTLKGDPVYDWLVANASRYGLKQLDIEFWHWSPTGG